MSPGGVISTWVFLGETEKRQRMAVGLGHLTNRLLRLDSQPARKDESLNLSHLHIIEATVLNFELQFQF